MSTKVIRFPRFTEPHSRAEVQSQWREITDRLNKFKAQLEEEFRQVYAAIPAPSAAAAPGPFNSVPASGTLNPGGGGGGPPATVPIPVAEVPSGAIPGTIYTLSFTPLANTLILTKNGVVQNPGVGNDYTLSGLTITMLLATIANDSLRATYWRN